ncbi:MAG: putative LPS assembly protein LptD [Parvularculaceae bacterium]
MKKRHLLSRLMATTALFGGVAYADGAEAPSLFVTAASQSSATPITNLSDMPVMAPQVARPGATVISALDDRVVPAALENTLFDEMDFGESDDEDVMAPSVDEPVTQLPPPTAEEPAAPPGGELSDDEILFEADFVSRETETSPIIAQGNVRAYFGERYLIADKLSYDPTGDIVIAEGNVSITDANMETAFAGRVELTGDLRDGIAENFSALLAQNAKLAADTAVQEQGARTRLTKAIYTACDVCKENGDAKTPTWAMRALRVTRDRERRVVQFHHAFFEIKGVPIFYLPFVQAPDPSVERQSGFLTPVVGASSRLGFNFELPYYFAISNHQDATFSPKYTSNDGVLWQGEYRRKDVSGEHVIQAGVIDFDNADPVESAGVPGRAGTPSRKASATSARTGAPATMSSVFRTTHISAVTRSAAAATCASRSTRRGRTVCARTPMSAGRRTTLNSPSIPISSRAFAVRTIPRSRPMYCRSSTSITISATRSRGGRAHINANFASLQRTGGASTRSASLQAPIGSAKRSRPAVINSTPSPNCAATPSTITTSTKAQRPSRPAPSMTTISSKPALRRRRALSGLIL